MKFVKVTGSGASTFGVRAWGDMQNPRKVHLGFQVQNSHEGFHFQDWSAHLVVTIIKIMMYWVSFGDPHLWKLPYSIHRAKSIQVC